MVKILTRRIASGSAMAVNIRAAAYRKEDFFMKAWLYYRLSRDEDEEMNSLQNQRKILLDYAEQNGYEVVGESFDDNVSGMTFNRKGLGEL